MGAPDFCLCYSIDYPRLLPVGSPKTLLLQETSGGYRRAVSKGRFDSPGLADFCSKKVDAQALDHRIGSLERPFPALECG